MARRDRRASRKQQRAGRSKKASPPRKSAGLRFERSAAVGMAQSLMKRGAYAQAFDAFERAIRDDPRNLNTYAAAAQAYATRYEMDKAQRVIDRLLELGPKEAGVCHIVGQFYSGLKLPERAIGFFERAVASGSSLPITWLQLAEHFERAHRLDECEALLDRVDQADPGLARRALVRARLLARRKQRGEAIEVLETSINRLSSDGPVVGEFCGELAGLLDRAGEYDAAWDAIQKAKRFHTSHCEAESRTSAFVMRRFEELAEQVTADHFARWRDAGAAWPEQSVALLTGFPRSGTTLLEQVVDAHPGVVSAEERDYLATAVMSRLSGDNAGVGVLEALDGWADLQIEKRERPGYLSGMQWFLGEPIDGRLLLDKNPAYNLLIPLMSRIFPQSHILVALRDPRDVVLSCYLRYLPLNPVSVNFLSVERTAQRYALDMNAWLKLRDIVPNPWCEVRYEDSVADLEKQARRALETLGLPWDPAVMNYRERLGKERQVNSPTYEAVNQPVYTRSVGRWKHYEEHLAPAFETLAPFIEAFGYEG